MLLHQLFIQPKLGDVYVPNSTNNPNIVNTIDPSAGPIFIYKYWNVPLNNLIVLFGILFSAILSIVTLYFKKKDSPH